PIPSPLVERGQGVRETNTMPGYAGSSWYFLRYMDPHNDKEFCSRKVSDYWGQVDLYIGGTEHAVGHLLYSRMWTKVLFDLGYIGFDEPYKKLVNQGMIQGSSRFVYRVFWVGLGSTIRFEKEKLPVIFLSKNLVDGIDSGIKGVIDNVHSTLLNILKEVYPDNNEFRYSNIRYTQLHVDVNIVDGVELNIDEFKKWRNGEYTNAKFILEDGSISSPEGGGREGAYICGAEVEKMSKSKFNTVNPDHIIEKYGADTFRMYEMFLGPIDQSKPWDTKGIEGVHRFLKKFWRLYADETKGLLVTDEATTDAEMKVLHKTIKKIEEDTERFSFNTAVSTFMIAINELTDLKCHKRSILEPLLTLLAPYAPHISEELFHQLNSSKVLPPTGGEDLGGASSILDAPYPKPEEKYLVESTKEYPISVNGKLRTTMNISLDAQQTEIEKIVLENEVVKKWTEGKSPKKIIYIKGKMVNVVV
ncbi:MAG: class I tRNA ligase family protein, partial [Bacteroidota bacterium]|nr:class I tRNA ligase family protein [Bacteroidota bacterium]